ncbi:MAG: carboxypeptidase regulatory-like domain-containing protein [Candidatus Acidiferrales bacterium]
MSFLKNALLTSLVLVLCAVFAMPTLAQDQSSARGNLSGLVYDSSQSLVPGAEVTVTGPIGSLTQNTSGQGSFLFSTLIPGLYSVRVTKPGFKVSEVGNVEVLINKTTSVSVTLEPGAITQVVEVASASLTVDTTASSVNTDIADTFYQNIPIQRNVASLFYLAPGAVSGIGTGAANPSISGSTGLENLYVADGVSINDPAFGGLGVWARAYGALGSGINLSFVKEVQVKTGGFEPQYGHASGGIVQVVTKSGSTSFHGAVGGYFNTHAMQDTYLNSDDPVYNTLNQVGRHINDGRYEADAEMGGYVPLLGLKDRLFWFGTFNPTWNQARWSPTLGNPNFGSAPSGLFDIYGTHIQYRTFSEDYAGKLTFKINNSHTVESSVFGDPNSRNNAPSPNLLNADSTSVNSSWNYGTRNWDTRYDGALSPTWTIDAAFTWSWNHFTEAPANIVQIVDQTQVDGFTGQRGTFTAQGFGFYEPYDSNTKSIQADTSKTYHFAGQHTFSFGYNWQYPTYGDTTRNSGPTYPIPAVNASGMDPGYATRPGVVGSPSDSALILVLADPAHTRGTAGCTLCPYMDVPGFATPQRVVLQQVRGRFDSKVTRSSGKYHAAYANDAWSIGTHVTLNAGIRWEQQRLVGNTDFHSFVNMWSPRFGIIVDPKGDRKSKIYANYGRYAYVLPLDAAIRSLSTESDFLNPFFAPASTTVGCPAGTPAGAPCVVTTASGTPDYANFFVPDGAHLLNNAIGGVLRSVNVAQNGGEPFAPGTRMEYTDEFVVGAEHQFRGGIVASARYIDRRLKRVIEDQGGISVEQFNALANNGGGLNYFIGNPNAKQDIFVNPNEQVFGGTGACTGSSNGITTDCTPVGLGFAAAYNTALTTPSPANAAALVAQGFPSACIDSHNVPTVYTAPDQSNTFGSILGSACFPAVNTGTWTTPAGKLLPDCTSFAQSQMPGVCAAFGGEFYPDGKPDTYKDPKREYEAVELEVNKAFSHNWAMVANWRIAQLRGNYEGAFRNDNGQADPGISSLFDLTQGDFGLIGQQQGIGPLNTNRKQVVNVYTTYVLGSGKLKNMVLGGGVKVQSGVPLTTLAAQQAYQNPGEVPVFGRGDLGNAPVTGSVDAHIEYPWKINDRFTMKFGMDLFNIADGRRQLLTDQNVDQGFQIKNIDFQKPAACAGQVCQPFQTPFQARGSVRLEF